MANENAVFKFDKAEPTPIFYKDTQKARAVANENAVFKWSNTEPTPVLFKDSERREQRQAEFSKAGGHSPSS
ncbi:hypothetical protein BARVI_04210 [Barnesiella viscericola DSM 18177]|uniref:Uncharacterized protein n=1 Tax=Barnesiella viscericola DSM 18177 TaxID=880074 RepID=W0EWY4_9BACT|nr:hypothetical protein BARVI_04210 [Barnesiella viscericola DSM 18177]